MTLPILAKKVKRIASMQIFNIKLLINGRGLSKFKKEYQLGKEMGQGGFGVVYRAVRLADGLPVAVKFIERRHVREWGQLNDERLPMEICMLARCIKVPGVVRLLDWFSVPEGFFIVMERPSTCVDLFDFIHSHGCLNEDLARFLFRQIVRTTIDCMKRKVLHRDIKDENVVINLLNGEIRLVDFGAATLLKKTRYPDFQGTRLYCPPEWFLHSLYLGTEATVWSLGVLLYNMLNGKLPFHNEKDICTAHLLGPLPFFARLSSGARNLIEKCLRFDPYRRPSLEAILEDSWLGEPAAEWIYLNVSANKKVDVEKKVEIPKAMQNSDNRSDIENRTVAPVNRPIFNIPTAEIDLKARADENNKPNNNNEAGRAESGVVSGASLESIAPNDIAKDGQLAPDSIEKQVSSIDLGEPRTAPRRNAKTSLLTSTSAQSNTLPYEYSGENSRNGEDKSSSRKIRMLRKENDEMSESFDSGVSAPQFLS